MWSRVLRLGKEVDRVLIFVAVIAMKGYPEFRQSSFHKWRFHDDAGEANVARGLQIDMVKRRRQIVSAIARPKLAESFRVGDRKFPVRAKSLDGIANFLGLRHSHRSRANPGNHADDAIVTCSAIKRVHHVA